MGFLNLGDKDEHGQQKRVEHHGKHLRVSRTGGASLRAQAKAAGLNLTANSQHGVRVSSSVGKNTQIAMQNGRFVLRGRYGKGPTKVNLSKSGITLSTHNQLGSFNWIKPNRSSAKMFGVQIRGKNAAAAQVFFMFFTLMFEVVRAATQVLLTILSWVWALLGALWRLLSMTPYAMQQVMRSWRNRSIRRAQRRLPDAIQSTIGSWNNNQLINAATLVFLAWGRGKAPREVLPFLQQASQASTPIENSEAETVSQALNAWQRSAPRTNLPRYLLAIVGLLGQKTAQALDSSYLPELLLEIDDLILEQGPKTRFQEQMLEVFGDAAGLRLELAETPGESPRSQ